jgi:enamine deaminase RidA (YjgF/YER057c/UK114 family)
MTRDELFTQQAQSLGYSFDGELVKGGNYVPLLRDGNTIYISGQVPRVDQTIVVMGSVGSEVSLNQAKIGAKVCVMRALVLLQRSLGSLDHVKGVLKMNVYVQSAQGFAQQSEVADGASDLLVEVLGPDGAHTRTSVGVFQLPRNASVEVDLIVRV